MTCPDDEMSGTAARLHLFMMLWQRNTISLLLNNRAEGDGLGNDLVVYGIDILDPVGYTVAHALQRRGVPADLENKIRSAYMQTPSTRPLLWGVIAAAVLADVMARSAPHLEESLPDQIRRPAHIGCVRALMVAGLGAELIQVPDAAGGPSPSSDIR